MSCLRAGALLERRAGGLDPAEQLFLERHLEACRSCAAEARALALTRELLDDGFELGELARRRALSRALAREERSSSATPERGRLPVLHAVVAAALTVLVGLVVWLASGSASAVTRLKAGAALPPDAAPALAELRRLHDGERFSAAQALSLGLAHARVGLDAGSTVRWQRDGSTLVLEAGVVRVDVAPEPKRAFRVKTAAFEVEVLGTAFEVTFQQVRVTRGRVRVLAGAESRELAAGEIWQLDAVERHVSTAQAPSAREDAPGVPALLARARSLLASGRVEAARTEIDRALALGPAPSDRAEAQSLLADCALVGGDPAEAKRRYAEIARQHAGKPAAETARFAAARLEKDPKRARGLLEEYLRLYPIGRFRAEAQARLKSLN